MDRDGIEDVVGNVFPQLDRFIGMATGAKPAALARERQKILILPMGVCAALCGESFVQVTASQVFLDHLIHNRPEEPVLSHAMLIITEFEISKVNKRRLSPALSSKKVRAISYPLLELVRRHLAVCRGREETEARVPPLARSFR